MAHRATHVCVRPCQRELGALVVIKHRGRPPLVHMAIAALCNSIFDCKLSAVRICVTGLTILRRALELDFVRARQCLVTFAASDTSMCADQWKLRFRVVETADVDPGLGAVAGFAAQRGSIGALPGHAVLELALVDIVVAGGASAVLEVERQDLVRSSAKARFVALGARDGHVRSRQHEMRALMLGDRKRRSMKILYGVAFLTVILIGSGGKLLVMRVLMAIQARLKFHFVESILAGRRVAFLAGNGRVFSVERVFRCGVLFFPKERRLPAIHFVAIGALAFARPRRELPLVRIRIMAIRALGEGQLLLEVSSGVALIAAHLHVHSLQRIFCF